ASCAGPGARNGHGRRPSPTARSAPRRPGRAGLPTGPGLPTVPGLPTGPASRPRQASRPCQASRGPRPPTARLIDDTYQESGTGRRPTWPEQNGMSVSVPGGGGRGAVTRVGRRRRGAPAGRGSLAAEELLHLRRELAGIEVRQIGLTGLLGTAAERGPTRAGTGRGLLRGLGLLACGLGRVLGLGLLDLLLRGLPAARLLAHAHAGAAGHARHRAAP